MQNPTEYRRSAHWLATLLSLGLVCLTACPSDTPGTNTDTGTDARLDIGPDLTNVADASAEVVDVVVDVGPAPTGTRAFLDWEADLQDPASFYSAPYPSDLRLGTDGQPAIGGMPNPDNNEVVSDLLALAQDRKGFPVIPVAWIRFDDALAPQTRDAPIPATTSETLMLLDVDPTSPERGRLFPLGALSLNEDPYTPANVLALAPWPGIVLPPSRTFAFVVRRGLNDAGGAPLGIPQNLWELAHGQTPEGPRGAELLAHHQPLWETLDLLAIPRTDVAAATIFTTGDVVSELATLVEVVGQVHQATIADIAVDPTDGATHDGFCELHATVTLPEFPSGSPPYNSGGLFQLGADGVPVKQNDVTVPLVIALPHGEMPADGFPLAVYIHGSGGLSGQLVDRGPIKTPGGPKTVGEGPAYVLAKHGIASASHAMPVNPERVPGASSIAYINFINLKAFRDLFRQGVIELSLVASALATVEIPAATLATCPQTTLPAGATAFRLDVTPLMVTGQSMGGMYANMWGATDKRVEVVAPTGAGGFWSHFILLTELLDAPPVLSLLLGTPEANLSFMHPALHVLQTAWEAAEPYVYMPRLGKRPLPGHPTRPVYEPAGQGDSFFSTELYDAYALAYGHVQAGDSVWSSMQASLALDGLDGLKGFPLTNNLTSVDGVPYTGAVVQYPGDGFTDPHSIYAQYPEVMHQYGCFFETFLDGQAVIVPPVANVGPPCETGP